MKPIKTTLASVLAAGLLVGSAAGVAAQDEAADELLFAIVDNPNTGIGEFTGYGDIPAGTVTHVQGIFEPPNVSAVHIIDPGPPGGDTFQISRSGTIRGTLDDGTIHGLLFWNVMPGWGTGEYADLTGKGRLFGIANLDDDWGTGVFVGKLGWPEE